MRKFTLLLLMLCLAGVCFAQGSIQDKTLRKECKKTLKLMKKGGWDVYASPKTIDEAVEQYYRQLEADGMRSVIIIGYGCRKSAQMAQKEANAMALSETAGMIESEVASATSLVMENLNSGKDVKSGMRYSNDVNVRVRQVLKGMRPSLQVYRKVVGKDKAEQTEVQVFYLVNNNDNEDK